MRSARSNPRNVSVARPNKVRAETHSDDGTERLLNYDGSQVMIWDKSAKVYTTVPLTGTLDEMIDQLEDDWDVSPPLADLLVANPYDSLTQAGGTGRLVGTSTIQNTDCHHLAFSQPGVDWAVWIGIEDQLPRKFNITFTSLPGQPGVAAEMSDWNLAATHPEKTFAPDVGDTRKIEMIPPPATSNGEQDAPDA